MSGSMAAKDRAAELMQLEHIVAACERFEALARSGGPPSKERF
jgi:hypothetical protein